MTDSKVRGIVLLTGAAVGATAGAIASFNTSLKHEMRRRGYPSWELCQCDYKLQKSFFQVWRSRYEQRGETIVVQEWGLYLTSAPQWLRRLLHHSAQYLATLNPRSRYIERITLSPQEAHQLASLLRGASSNIDLPSTNALMVWRHEVLHAPQSLFDRCTRRLYPAHMPAERADEAEPHPALWDPYRALPLPASDALLEMPIGTRIDYIGWTPSQVAYCTARLEQAQ